MRDELIQKLDARGLQQLLRGPRGKVSVLLRTAAPPTPQQRFELQQAGAVFRTIAGNVMSATVPNANQLEDIALLPFVRRIELSRILFDE